MWHWSRVFLKKIRQIIRGAKNFLQEVIFKFKLPPKPVPKIDLQEWKDMQKVMYDLQG